MTSLATVRKVANVAMVVLVTYEAIKTRGASGDLEVGWVLRRRSRDRLRVPRCSKRGLPGVKIAAPHHQGVLLQRIVTAMMRRDC